MHALLADLESKISSRSSQERVTLLRSVTDLFLLGASQLSEEKIEIFDDVLCQLIEDIEQRALAELSKQVAPVDSAPMRLVRRLAHNDDIDVSGPILAESSRLPTDDLIELASTKSQAHLAAIARRKIVETRVSDVLVERGDDQVAQIVAQNAGARFSQTGYSKLVTRAERQADLAHAVAGRADLPPELLHQLVTRATDTVRQRLLATAAPEARARIDTILGEIATAIDYESPPRDYSRAQRFVQSIRSDQRLMRASLRDFAQAGNVEHSVALLASLSGMPIPAVERALLHGHVGGVLLLCRAVDVDWATVTAVLSLRGAHGGGQVTASEDLLEQFQKLTVATSQRVVRFWQVRENIAKPDDRGGEERLPPLQHARAQEECA